MQKTTTSLPFSPALPTRAAYRWLLASVMIIVIAFGWKYPLLGFAVPAAMFMGIATGFFRGRYACGNLCPRGSFFDTLYAQVAGSRPVPALLRSMSVRWPVVSLLMGFMTVRLLDNPADPMHWGRVFWFMCAVTTAVGLVLGRLYNTRAWCSVCPVGTLANAAGGDRGALRIAADCSACRRCEGNCPMGLSIAEHRSVGVLPHRDCIRCSSCQTVCPRGALDWP